MTILRELRPSADYDYAVQQVQLFLKQDGLYTYIADGIFGDKTAAAVKKYERLHGLTPDGVVDDDVWRFMIAGGLALSLPRRAYPESPVFRALTTEQRHEKFGRLEARAAPTPRNKEAIAITNDFQKEYITRLHVPQFAKLWELRGNNAGFPKSGNILWNKMGEERLLGFWQEVQDQGLLSEVLTYAGAWVPRYIRGIPGVFSSHAWGTAFDINAAWNGLGRRPASADARGCVYSLVPIAQAHGFFWGGHFSRPDGMHFELAVWDKEPTPA